MTEARRVYEYHYGQTSEQKLDALQHLTNICLLKARRPKGPFWLPRPALHFVGARTSRNDWENVHYGIPQKFATRGWVQTSLPEHLSKYAPQHITKRELLGLICIRDQDLLHTCNALIFDLMNASAKQGRHEINCTRLWTHRGSELYFDDKLETAVQPERSATLFPGLPEPDYKSAIQMLVRDKKLRAALSPKICQIVELIFRKLDAGVAPGSVVSEVAIDIGRDEHTVRRHLRAARRISEDVAHSSHQIVQLLASLVLPAEEHKLQQSKPARPTLGALAKKKIKLSII